MKISTAEQFQSQYGEFIPQLQVEEPNKLYSLNQMGPVKTENFDPYSKNHKI